MTDEIVDSEDPHKKVAPRKAVHIVYARINIALNNGALRDTVRNLVGPRRRLELASLPPKLQQYENIEKIQRNIPEAVWFFCDTLTEEQMMGSGDRKALLEWSRMILPVLPFHMKAAVRCWYMAACQSEVPKSMADCRRKTIVTC